ncbi:glycerophosphodiester phosphodiesterase [Brachybacterium sp. DNPG3]
MRGVRGFQRAQRPMPAIVGHRGAAGLAPENTLAAFRRAVEEGAALLECDVHPSADGLDAVIHDATIDRTAQADSPLRTGAVADLSRAQLDRVLVGADEHIPTLERVLDEAVREDGTRVPVLFEVKVEAVTERVLSILADRFGDGDRFGITEPAGAEPAAEPVAEPAERPASDAPAAPPAPVAPAWIISFHPEVLRIAAERAPHIPRRLTTTSTTPEFFEAAVAVGATQVGVRIADARQADVETCARLGLQLNLWTARSAEELERALELGCDTLTVDDPAWARDRLAQIAADEVAFSGPLEDGPSAFLPPTGPAASGPALTGGSAPIDPFLTTPAGGSA